MGKGSPQLNEKSAPAGRAASIMIVEDEGIVAKDIETSLADLGYTISGVLSSGEEALAAVGKLKPDLILMDIMLQGKLDGVEAARQIMADSGIPVIFLTAYSDESTISRARETNAYGYLLKPFEERELRSTIEMALYKSAMERKLKHNREWLASILHSISDGVFTTNVEGLIEFCNPVAERLSGWTAAEMADHRLAEVVSLRKKGDMSVIEINPDLIIRNGVSQPDENEVVLTTRNGAQIDIEYNATPLKHSDGNVVGIILVLRDIAARRTALAREHALQKRLARAQRMESVGMLANGVAEMLRCIIEPIVDYPRLIASKMSVGNDINQDLDMIGNSARKAIEILANLITIGQMKDFSMEPLHMNEIVEEIANDPRYQNKQQNMPMVRFQIDLAGRTSPIIGNRQNLLKLVVNLVASFSDCFADEGLVKISTTEVKIEEPIHGFEIIEAGEYMVLRITDNGPVMSEGEINRFFEPFAGNHKSKSHRRGGTLDTAVAYAIIKGHKGIINIKSSLEKGTEIAVYFPVYTGPEKPVEHVETVDVHGIESVLVVDDDADLRKTTMGYLRSIGYKVSGARNGSEALELVRQATQGAGQAIDILIIDMIMADDFDGLETYKGILHFNPLQKAIIVSGFTMTERIKAAMRLGVGQCILKPYDHENIAMAIRKELDKPERKTTQADR